MLLRARIVLTMTGPPINDGAVLIAGNEVRWAAPWKDIRPHAAETPIDCGETALLPGLINAHCHLDYTALAGRVPPTRAFADWIKAMAGARGAWTADDYSASWRCGARQLLEGGATSVVNVESAPGILRETLVGTPLRLWSLIELSGFGARRETSSVVEEALAAVETARTPRCNSGLSPHSPYATSSSLLAQSAAAAQKGRLPLSIHVSESQAEFDMFMYRRGPLYEWLAPQRPMDDCGRWSPVRHCDHHGVFESPCLAVHANYLWHGDAALLARRGVSVVHCPRSHQFFRHQRFPGDALRAAGVNICLGTDSLASTTLHRDGNTRLSMFSEMQALAAHDALLSPGEILAMATRCGARALGLSGRLGELSPGACADIIAIPWSGGISDAEAAAVHHSGSVSSAWIDGEPVIPPAA